MAEARPRIPEAIKREVRQWCGFGCVLCGKIIVQYDHMTDRAVVQEDTADNLTLLCAEHHDQKTRGLITEEQVRAWNADPINRRSGVTGAVRFPSGPPVVTVGMLRMTHHGLTTPDSEEVVVLGIDDQWVFKLRMENGFPLVSMALADEDNNVVLLINENELTASTGRWDLVTEGTTITIRDAPGEIFASVTLDPERGVSLSRGRIMRNGVEIEVWPDCIGVVNNGATMWQYGDQPASMGDGTLIFGTPTQPCVVVASPIERNPPDMAALRANLSRAVANIRKSNADG